MRILHIEDRFHPEVGYQINFLARLHSSEHEFIILTSNSFSIWGNSNLSDIIIKDNSFSEKYKVKINRLSAFFAKGNKNNIWIKGLIRKVLEIKPDIIYVHCIESYSAARIILSWRLRKYVIITDTHNLYNQFRKGLKYKIYMFLFRILVVREINNRKIKVFFTAEENRQILVNDYGIENDHIISGLIGTEIELFYFDKNEAFKLRSELKIGKENIILLYTGKINGIKQPHLIFEAVKIIEHEINIPVTLVFVGSVDQEYFNKFCLNAFINKNISTIWHPQVPNTELYRFYSMSDFAVFPRHNTLSSLDAQACKLPVIMESDLTNDERLKYGGLTFESENLQSLANSIKRLIQDQGLRERLGTAGFNYVKGKYNYIEIIRNMELEMERKVSENQIKRQ
jgi:glycosyltransferase involved in cell wall biosynthesis